MDILQTKWTNNKIDLENEKVHCKQHGVKHKQRRIRINPIAYRANIGIIFQNPTITRKFSYFI